jgi:nitrogen regulatory protein P-II 1
MKEIKAIIRPERLESVLHALHLMPQLPGLTVSRVTGYGRRFPVEDAGVAFADVDMAKLEIVVPTELAPTVVSAIEQAAHTGHVGDGKIFVSVVEHAVKVRSGERDALAL